VREAIGTYRELLPPGSLYVLSSVSPSDVEDEEQAQLHRLEEVSKRTGTPGVLRTRAELLAFFGDFALVEPGLVPVGQWHPDDLQEQHAELRTAIGGVARKPGTPRP